MEFCNGGISNGDVLGLSSKREKLIIDTDPGIGEFCIDMNSSQRILMLSLRVS